MCMHVHTHVHMLASMCPSRSIAIGNQVVCTSTLALGGRTLAEHKAIVTRLSSIEQLAGRAMLCSDPGPHH